MAQSPFPDTHRTARPVQAANNADAVTFTVTGIDTTGQVVYVAERRQGVELVNEDTSNDARVFVTSSTEGYLLPKRVGDITSPRFIPGQGAVTVKAAAGTVSISGLAY